MNHNIVELLYCAAAENPSKTALIHNGKSVNFSELASRVRSTAHSLQKRGIGYNDHVLFFIPMSIPLYAMILACWHCGAVALFMDAWAGRKRLQHAATLAQCKGFTGVFQAKILKQLVPSLRKIPISLPVQFPSHATAVTDTPSAEVNGKHPALITFTTGSTGIPKAANRTHGYLRSQHEVLKSHLSLSQKDIDLVTLPIFVFNNLASGITSVIPDCNPAKPQKVNPSRLYRDMSNYRVSSSSGSPYIFERLAEYCTTKNNHLDHLRKIFIGGAPVFPSLAEKLCRAFPHAQIEIVYGSTEAEPISTIDARVLLDKTDSLKGLAVGKPIPAIDLRIIPFTDESTGALSPEQFQTWCLAPGQTGEICVSGKHVLTEYFKNPLAWAQNKIPAGPIIWHRTGDAGYLDDSGELYLMGRAGQRFTFNDMNYFLMPLEERLEALTGCCATVLESKGELTLFIEPRKKMLERSFLHSCLLQTGLPKTTHIMQCRIPRDPRHNSKIDYGRLSKRLITKENIH